MPEASDSAESPYEGARRETIRYHEGLYAQHRLFEPGSWLKAPASAVLRALDHFEPNQPIRVLDLGCGVGRHAIPIARRIGSCGGNVTCIDLLPSAIEKLTEYAQEHGVLEHVFARAADIESLDLPTDEYDLVVACSCLEHVSSSGALCNALTAMRRATKEGGVHVLMISTDPKRSDAHTGEVLACGFELPLTLTQARAALLREYAGWRILETLTKPWVTHEVFAGRETVLRSTCLSFVACAPQGPSFPR